VIAGLFPAVSIGVENLMMLLRGFCLTFSVHPAIPTRIAMA